MIVDSLENVKHYRNLSERIKKVFEFLEEIDFEIIEPGRYNVEGDEIFALVSKYNTKKPADALPEAHERYIDIQYMVTGEENIGYAPLEDQDIIKPYDAENDIVFYQAQLSNLRVSKGMFVVFFPNDIHAPGIMVDTQKPVKKVVIKVLA